MKVIVLALLVGFASAFAPQSAVRQSTQLRESFGFSFAEDSYANTDDFLKGEQEYKQFVNRISDNNMLNRKVSSEKNSGTWKLIIWPIFVIVSHPLMLVVACLLAVAATVQCHPSCARTGPVESHRRQ